MAFSMNLDGHFKHFWRQLAIGSGKLVASCLCIPTLQTVACCWGLPTLLVVSCWCIAKFADWPPGVRDDSATKLLCKCWNTPAAGKQFTNLDL